MTTIDPFADLRDELDADDEQPVGTEYAADAPFRCSTCEAPAYRARGIATSEITRDAKGAEMREVEVPAICIKGHSFMAKYTVPMPKPRRRSRRGFH
jgi:hypothetical protein